MDLEIDTKDSFENWETLPVSFAHQSNISNGPCYMPRTKTLFIRFGEFMKIIGLAFLQAK